MRITLNAVLVNKVGEVCFIRELPIPGEARKKNREIFVNATGAVVPEAEAKPMPIADVPSLLGFVTAFNDVPQKPRSGYDQYYNDFGPTNPISPRELTTDGLVKNLAIFLNALHERVAKGGAVGDEAKAALALLTSYNEVASDTIIAAERETLLTLAASQFSPEQIAAAKAKLGIVPAATVTAAEANDTDADVQATLESEEIESRVNDAVAAEVA